MFRSSEAAPQTTVRTRSPVRCLPVRGRERAQPHARACRRSRCRAPGVGPGGLAHALLWARRGLRGNGYLWVQASQRRGAGVFRYLYYRTGRLCDLSVRNRPAAAQEA